MYYCLKNQNSHEMVYNNTYSHVLQYNSISLQYTKEQYPIIYGADLYWLTPNRDH